MSSSNMCYNALSNLTSSEAVDMFSYSGKGINDLGKYENCEQSPNNAYYILHLYLGDQVVRFYTGLCFAANCTAQQITELIPNITSALGVNISGLGVDVRKVSGSEASNSMDSSSVGIITLCFILATLPLIHPIWNYLQSSLSFPKNKPTKDSDKETAILNQTLVSEDESRENKPKPPKKSKLFGFFECFSITENISKLLSIREGPLDFCNGIRALSLLYVIFGHDYYLRSQATSNPEYLMDFIRTPFFLFIGSAFYSVDVFFWLSGFFLAFVLLDPATKKYLKKPLTYGFAIFHRYCRIIPSYLIAILIYWKIVTLTGSGPLWQDLIDRSADCQYLWRNMLFIDNLFSLWGDSKYCFGWGWYLSNDFQLFFLSLLIIFIYALKPIVGKIFIVLSIMGTSAAGLIVAYNGHFRLFPYVIDGYGVYDFMNEYYYKPYCRAPPYLLGLFLGVLYKEYVNAQKELEENKINHNKTLFASLRRKFEKSDMIRMFFYASGLFIILFLSFFQRQVQLDQNNLSDTFQLIFISFQRLLYVFGLSLFLMNNFIYKKDIVGKFLSWKPFGVITKLNFCAYLVHYFIIERSMLNVKQATYYNAENIFYFFFTDFIFTIILSSLLSLCVEIPFVNLERFLKGGKREHNKKTNGQQINEKSKSLPTSDEANDELKKTEVKEKD